MRYPGPMSSNLPVAEMLARLERKVAYHREQEELHAREESAHAEQRALHGAEHRKAVEQLEALRSVSATVVDLIAGVEAPPPPPRAAEALPEKVARGKGHWVADLLERAIGRKAPGEVFGATSLIDDIQALWGPQLRHGIDPRSAAATLRRWAADGRLEIARKGTSHREGLYTKR